MRKRMLSVLLCLVMVISLLPTAFATDVEGGNGEGTTIAVSDNKAYALSTKTEYDSLDEAMEKAANVDTIYLGAGTYCGNTANPTNKGNGAGKSLTFVGAGTGKTTWQIRALDNPISTSDGPCDYSFEGSDSITFEKVTVIGSVYPDGTTKANDTQGLVRINNITLKDCTFNGRADYWGYKTTTFDNVTFNAPGTEASGIDGTNYSLWTYTGNTYTFKNCTFNSTGKTINVYRHNAAQFTSDVTINYENCTVINTAHKKQAMKINDSTTGDKYKYIINISGSNTVDGIEPNTITCSRLFGFDEEKENAGHTQVIINGVTVWERGKRQVAHNCTDIVAGDTGSYTNGVDGSDASVLYTDGYKDNAFTTSYGSWEWDQNKNQLARTVTKTCDYCGETVETTEYKDLELDVSRSKTATALDSNDRSTVTLSLPSAEENLATDVVLALDVSKCTKDTLPAVQSLLNDLSAVQKESGANIKIGIAMFKGSAVPFQELVTLTPDKNTELQILFNQFLSATGSEDAVEDAVRAYLKTKFTTGEYLNTGTNMPAGLLLAKKMLDEDTAVKANRKYMILVSDGSTYLFTHDNDYSTAWSRQHEPGSYQGGLYELNWRHSDFLMGKDTTVADWTSWLESVGEFSKTFTDEYDYEWKGANTTCPKQIPNSRDVKYLINGDTSIYQSAMFYKQMQEDGYNCYYCYTYDSEDNYGRNALRSLNDDAHLIDGANTQNVFSSIEKDIIFAVGADSVVEDKMGEDFGFVPGTLKLTVGGKELASKTEGDVTYFGDSADALSETNYRFKVLYDPTNDAFAWTINDDVSNFAPVQLSYQVKLVNRSTTAGTYTVPTNEYAKLTPTNSEGYVGKALEFPKPAVTYTVSGGGSGGGGSSTTYYYFAIKKIDAQDSHTLNGAKFGLYLDGKQIAIATSNQSGIATFRIDGSNYRKIDTESNLYYQELTAPEGYVVSSDKIDIEKSDLTTTQTTAEKNAETVRNYQKNAPAGLNGDDHVAYVHGYPDGTVKPNNNVTRAETATMLYRLLTANRRNEIQTTNNSFSDVSVDDWYNESVSTMANGRYVTGYPDGTFGGNKNITRAEFVTMLVRFIGVQDEDCSFTDVSKDYWAYSCIATATKAGWIAGYPDSTFKPEQPITRAEAMTIINQVLNRGVNEKSELLNFKVWPDNESSAWYYYDVIEASNEHEYTGSRPSENWTSLHIQ